MPMAEDCLSHNIPANGIQVSARLIYELGLERRMFMEFITQMISANDKLQEQSLAWRSALKKLSESVGSP